MAANNRRSDGYGARPAANRYPTVAIVGRPNVGKSALFNLIVRRRQAIVHEQSGVTRDRAEALAEFGGRPFIVVDTGGLGLYRDEKGTGQVWDQLIREQLLTALAAADRVIMVTDVQAGVMPLDQEVAALLRESGKPVVVAANKADNGRLEDSISEFAELGFTQILPLSCIHSRGVGPLLEVVTKGFPAGSAAPETAPLRIAVVGRPNVGKSSIINRLLGEDRVIVSDVPGTTRDAIDVPFTIETPEGGIPAVLVDTAGIRRRGKIDTVVEFFSMSRTEDAIKSADVVLIVLDATCPGTAQDRKICRLVADAGKATLLLLNKWDLASAEIKQKELLAEVGRLLPFMDYVEAMTCCAVSGYNLQYLLPKILELREVLTKEYSTSLVNRVVRDSVMRLPPPPSARGALKIYYGVCLTNRPPTFLLFVNHKVRAPQSYLQYLRHQFVRAFEIRGIPVVVQVRNRRPEDRPPDTAPAVHRARRRKEEQRREPRPRPARGKEGERQSSEEPKPSRRGARRRSGRRQR